MPSLAFDVFWRDRGAQKGLQNLGQAVKSTEGHFNRFKGNSVASMTAAGVAAKGVVAGMKAVKNGLVAPIAAAGKFESSMRLVGVTTGKTGKGLEGLTKVAIKMGAETSFSAQGASDAMLALAKGGLTAAEMKAGALKQTLTLATAGGLELGNAADFMVQGLSAFGLKAKDAGRVAAALAGGANASTASVESMGQALSQVGAGAKVAGLSIEDTTAALAAFSNAGVQGSDAGTSLKTFLQRLVPSTKKTSDAMKELGLITKEGGNQFFDAQGKVKSMADISGILQNTLKDQTKEQKIATLTTIFGSDASRAAAILADEGAKGLAKYTKATSDKSQAEKLARNATLGYAGAMERFKGSIETAQIQVGTKFLPSLTKMLDFLSGKAMPAISRIGRDLAPAFSVAAKSAASFGRIAVGTFKAFATALTGGKATFKDFSDYMSTHQGDIVSGFVTAGKAVIAFAGGLATGLSAGLRAFGALSDGVGHFTSFSIDQFGLMLNAAVLSMSWMPGIGPRLNELNGKFKVFADHARGDIYKTGDAARSLADGIDGKLKPALDKAGRSMDAVGKKEIIKARTRDAVAKAALAIQDLGTKSDGSQIKLKTFADRTKLSASEARGLHNRLSGVRGALRDQLGAMRDAGAGQAKLSKAWETGRDRLYKEFRQMGLSREEARKLAKQYAGVPPKVQTKVTQPGMKDARRDTKDLDDKINDLNSKRIAINVRYGSSGSVKLGSAGKSRGTNSTLGGNTRAGMASGGVMPGWTPGRDVHHFTSATAGNLDLSGGEGVLIPQATKRLGGEAGIKWINDAARTGKSGTISFATGGVIPPSHAWVTASPAERALARRAYLRQFGSFQTGSGLELTTSYRNRFRDKAKAERFAHTGGEVLKLGKFWYAFAALSKKLLGSLPTKTPAKTPTKPAPGQKGHPWDTASNAERIHAQHAWLQQFGSFNNGSIDLMKRAYRDRYKTEKLALRSAGKGGDAIRHAGDWYAFSNLQKFKPGSAFAGGGVYRNIVAGVHGNNPPDVAGRYASAVADARNRAQSMALASARAQAAAEVRRQKKAIAAAKAAASGGGDPGGPAMGGGRNRVRWKGGTFTERFRNTLIRAQRIAGTNIPVFQGGFSSSVAASGRSHLGDAIDTARNGAILRGLRKARVAAWNRGPAQGFINHIHGIPLPGAGFAGGSGVWQAQDYLRGGDGLAKGAVVRGGRGGVVTRIGEGKRDELVAPLPKNWEHLVRVVERGGNHGTHVTINVNAPHWIGDTNDLKRKLVHMAKSGDLDSVIRKVA